MLDFGGYVMATCCVKFQDLGCSMFTSHAFAEPVCYTGLCAHRYVYCAIFCTVLHMSYRKCRCEFAMSLYMSLYLHMGSPMILAEEISRDKRVLKKVTFNLEAVLQ